jgi:hypothetical protein
LFLGYALGKGVDYHLFFSEGGFGLPDIRPNLLKLFPDPGIIGNQAPNLSVGLA